MSVNIMTSREVAKKIFNKEDLFILDVRNYSPGHTIGSTSFVVDEQFLQIFQTRKSTSLEVG